MKTEFWRQCWREGRTPWHEGIPNARLRTHFDRLDLRPGERVFVPLCGKSEDMWWLHERGAQVLGIDLSPLAARAFLQAHGLAFTETRGRRFTMLERPGFRLLAGDFFRLRAADLAGVAAVYDRAALVALPAPMRRRYAERLAGLLAAPILLVSLEYPEGEIEGPPFPVREPEIRALFGARRRVAHLGEEDVLESSGLRKRGLTRLHEHGYLIGRGFPQRTQGSGPSPRSAPRDRGGGGEALFDPPRAFPPLQPAAAGWRRAAARPGAPPMEGIPEGCGEESR